MALCCRKSLSVGRRRVLLASGQTRPHWARPVRTTATRGMSVPQDPALVIRSSAAVRNSIARLAAPSKQ